MRGSWGNGVSAGCRGGAKKVFLGRNVHALASTAPSCMGPTIPAGYRGWKAGVGRAKPTCGQLEGLFLRCFKGPRQELRCWGASLGMGPAAVAPGGVADRKLGSRVLWGIRKSKSSLEGETSSVQGVITACPSPPLGLQRCQGWVAPLGHHKRP